MHSRTPEEQQKLNNQLLKHAKSGDSRKVRADLDKGAEITATNNEGLNALQLAEQGKKACKEALKKYVGVEGDVNQRMEQADLAVDQKCYELIITLLKHHSMAQVFSPLHYAVQDGDEAKVKDLLRAGADANNIFRETGETSLHIAAKFGHARIARLLLDCGAKLEIADHQGRTPLDIAKLRQHADVVKLLLAGNKPPIAGTFSLKVMCGLLEGNKYYELEELFIEHQCAAYFMQNTSVLAVAAKIGSVEMARMLLQHGAFINEVSQYASNTPLHVACSEGHFEVAEFLLSCNARTDLKNRAGNTAFQIAICKDRMQALYVFDRKKWHKAVIEMQLIIAVKFESLAEVERCLNMCPDFIFIREDDKSLLHLAAERGDVAICKLLIDHGAADHIGVDLELVKLKRAGIKFNPAHTELTPLTIAFRAGHDDVFMFLHGLGNRIGYLNYFVASSAQTDIVLSHQALPLVLSEWVALQESLSDVKSFTTNVFGELNSKFIALLLLAFQKNENKVLSSQTIQYLRTWFTDKIKEKGGSEIKRHLLAIIKEIPDLAERLAMYELALGKPKDNWIRFALSVKQNILDPRKCDTIDQVELLAKQTRQQLLQPDVVFEEQPVAVAAVAAVAAPAPILSIDEFEFIQASPPVSPLLQHSRFAPVRDNAAPLPQAPVYQEIEMQDVVMGKFERASGK